MRSLWLTTMVLVFLSLSMERFNPLVKGKILPSHLTGKYTNKILSVVAIKIGTIPKKRKAVVDWSSSVLTTAFPIDSEVSRSFTPALGGSDLVKIGSEEVLFKTVFNPAMVAFFNCSECSAVIGVGSGSPVWLHFSTGIYTSGGLIFDEYLEPFEVLSRGKGNLLCEILTSEICITTGVVLGRTVRVVFGSRRKATLLPGDIFLDYAAGKSLKNNPDWDDWDDITIRFPAIPGTGHSNSLRIRADTIVVPAGIAGGEHLMVDVSPLDDTVFIGSSAILNYMLKIHKKSGTAQVISYRTRKHYTLYGLLVLCAGAVLFNFWRGRPNGAWDRLNYRAPYRILVAVTTSILAIVTYAFEESESTFPGYPVVNVYIGIVLSCMIVWQILSFAIYFYAIRNLFGCVGIKPPPSLTSPTLRNDQQKRSGESEETEKDKALVLMVEKVSQMEKSNIVSSRKAAGAVSSSLPVDNLLREDDSYKKKRFKSKGYNLKNTSLIGPYFWRSPEDAEIEKQKKEGRPRDTDGTTYFNPRLWIVLGISHETLIMLITLMVFMETRAEGFWGLALTMTSLYSFFNLLYYGFITMYLPHGQPSALWIIFQFFLWSLIVTTLVISGYYIVGPTVERLLSSNFASTILCTIVVYLVMIYWASIVASHKSLLELKKMLRSFK